MTEEKDPVFKENAQGYLNELDPQTREVLEQAFEHVLISRDSDIEPKQTREIEPIRTWLRSRYYNVMARSLYDYWEEEIVDFCENAYNEWVITGSIGTGKSTAALLCALRKLYELSCWEHPQRLFKLADMTKIFFAYLSVNIKQAELTGFGQIREQIDQTPYFKENYQRDNKITSVLRFPGDVFFIPGSDQISFIGTNLFGCILDEMNFLRTKGGTIGDASKAQAIYQEATDRRRSRFMYQGKDPGFSLLVSSSTHQSSFTESRMKAAATSKTTKVTVAKLWEVKPQGSYSNKVFYVFNGSEREDAFLIKAAQDAADLCADPIQNARIHEAIRVCHDQTPLPCDGEEEPPALEADSTSPTHEGRAHEEGPVAREPKKYDWLMEDLGLGGDHDPEFEEKMTALEAAQPSHDEQKGTSVLSAREEDDPRPDEELILDFIWPHLPDHVQNAISRVPIDFRESFEGDLYTALKNIAGVSIAPVGRLFTSRALWAAACSDPEVKNPFMKETFALTMKGDDLIQDYFRTESLFGGGEMLRLPYEPRYLRVDQSKNYDHTGIACVHRAGWAEATGIRMPIVETDFMIKIKPPPKPDKIGFHKVRSFIIMLRDLGMKIGGVSFDQYQSEDHMQLLELAGIKTSYMSVDKTDKAYLAVVNLLQEGRLRMYLYDPLRTEFFNLEHDRAKAKVDHPAVNPDGTRGSKDVADALAGAVFQCAQGVDTGVPDRAAVLNDTRAIGPDILQRNFSGGLDFNWLLPKEYRGKVEIQVVKVGSSLGGTSPEGQGDPRDE